MESVIEDDGTYRVVLAPVKDFDALLAEKLGNVSDVDRGKRSFTLTIDPEKVPEAEPPRTGPIGRRFPPRRGPRPPQTDDEAIASAWDRMVKMHGAENLILLRLKNCKPFTDKQIRFVVGSTFKASKAKRARPLRLPSGDQAHILVSSADVVTLGKEMTDFGKVASDAAKREIVVTLEEGKLK